MGVNTTSWDPADRDDAEFKKAVDNVFNVSLSSVVMKSPDGTQNRFILQTQGYHDIYLYVVAGIKFESSKTEFEKTFPRKVFAKVDEIDASAFNFLRDTTTSIGTNTKDFNKNGLGRLISSANGAITYADYAIGLLKTKTNMSLWTNLNILLDEKYAKSSAKDDDFVEAMEGARMVVQELSRSAKAKSEDAKSMVALLEEFHNLTTNDVANVQAVKQNWIDGPLDSVTGKRKRKSDGKEQECYADIIDAEVARLQKEIISSGISRDKEDDKWKVAKNAAIGLGVAGAFIWWLQIGTAVETDKAIKAKAEYNRLVDLISDDQAEKATNVRVLELVNALTMHLSDMLPKMKEALKAMVELQNLFNEQDRNFMALDDSLSGMEKGVVAKSLALRKDWILEHIDDAVEKLTEIKDLAMEFQRGAHPDIINKLK
ncbi:alpha-xenorhabdolysin family binary toxin subunit A [Microdochium nivale]|nr:alpha-xenorhabdolysin family binary toxin subunit A [Microdochium nivale]